MATRRRDTERTPKVEIALTEEEAAVAKRLLLHLINGVAVSQEGPAVELGELARGILEARNERRHFFPDGLLGDPAWDMILSLYCAEGRDSKFSVTDLGNSVGLPQTTALRWINELEEAGLLDRRQDDRDRRRSFICLSDSARDKVTQWLTRLVSRLGAIVAGQEL
jgi:DNA-binding MarR family transcriptional regulator